MPTVCVLLLLALSTLAPERHEGANQSPAPSSVTLAKEAQDASQKRSQVAEATSQARADSDAKKFVFGVVGGLAGAIIGLFGTAFAWVYVPAKIRRSEDRAKFIETQLSELYGPMLGECIRTDRMFLQIEWTIANSFEDEHHHSRLAPLLAGPTEQSNLHSFFASVVRTVYHPANLSKIKLLKDNVHLFGPYPPLSFHLLLNHAAELDAILALGKEKLLLSAVGSPLRPDTVGRVAPFPMALTAEVLAKVVLLKKLQKEYRSRLSSIRAIVFGERKVFNRERYFLELRSDIRSDLDKLNTCNSYTCANFPLLWRPYLPVELIEMRSWFIGHADLLADQPNLEEHRLLTGAFLSATIIFADPQGDRSFNLDCRVFQAFDSLDPLRSKQRIIWRTVGQDVNKHVDTKQKSDVRFSALRIPEQSGAVYSLEHCPPNEDFAQNPKRYSLLHRLHKRPKA